MATFRCVLCLNMLQRGRCMNPESHSRGKILEGTELFSTMGVYNMPDGQPKLGGVKHDEGKPQLGLISKVFLWGLAGVMTEGVKEYGAHNWRGGMDWNRPYDALQRHLTAFWDGENLDPKSGRSHLYHAAAELMFLAEYAEKGMGKDNRFIAPTKESANLPL